MEDDILDWLVAGGIAVVALVWIVGAAIAASGGGFGLEAILFAFLGLIFLFIAFGVYRRTPEAWGIGLAIFGFALAWSILAILFARQLPSGGDLLILLAEAGVLAYLVVRRRRFHLDRTAAVTTPPGTVSRP